MAAPGNLIPNNSLMAPSLMPLGPLSLSARIEHWPLGQAFTISRGSKAEAIVVVAAVSDGVHTGRGECVPYPRYGETPEATLETITAMSDALRRGMDPM